MNQIPSTLCTGVFVYELAVDFIVSSFRNIAKHDNGRSVRQLS